MANKKDLKSSMAAGITGGLDSLIQPTAAIQEPEQPKKEKAVHCNFASPYRHGTDQPHKW